MFAYFLTHNKLSKSGSSSYCTSYKLLSTLTSVAKEIILKYLPCNLVIFLLAKITCLIYSKSQEAEMCAFVNFLLPLPYTILF